MSALNRRKFIGLMSAGLASPYIISSTQAKTLQTNLVSNNNEYPLPDNSLINIDSANEIFPQSVASGDPTDSGVILWTRVNPVKYSEYEPLIFQVCLDNRCESLYLQGEVHPEQLSSLLDYTVKIDLDGQLEPNRTYYYRFIYKNTSSKIGRCRTTPSNHSTLKSLKIAVLTCQDFTNGYYGVYDFIAKDSSIDFVVHLGDFVYESTGDKSFQANKYDDRKIKLPSESGYASNLDDYRHIYRRYRQDEYLTTCLESHTWIMTTDDHETANDCYWDYVRDTLGAPDHPYTKDSEFGNNEDLLRSLKLSAQQAWFEYTPTRAALTYDKTHPHQFLRIYRHFTFGDLVTINMLDTRTYRTAPPCGDRRVFERYFPIGCTDQYDAENSMLGYQQKEWLFNNLSSSKTVWNVLGNQTYMGRLAATLLGQELALLTVDSWDGFQYERRQLAEFIRNYNVDNFVVLTGDLHCNISSYLKVDYEKSLNTGLDNNLVGVEFMTPSVTSTTFLDGIEQHLKYKVKKPELLRLFSEGAVRINNPHIKTFNANDHGYATLEFFHDHCEWVVYGVSKETSGHGLTKRPISHVHKYTELPWLFKKSTQNIN